jgi:hypothetical protein
VFWRAFMAVLGAMAALGVLLAIATVAGHILH